MEREQLIQSIRKRSGTYGLMTADRYFRDIEKCNGGACPANLFDAKDAGLWATKLSEAESKLTYSDKSMVVEKTYKEAEMVKNALMMFDAVVTTTRKDRDGDILRTKGASVDPNLPLLWQHMPIQPIGAMAKVLEHTDDLLRARFAIADTSLGRDAATLIELGGLRISHGFDPTEYDVFEDESGYEFLKFTIFEVSAVSVPSNIDAVITAYSREKLHHPAVKAWAGKAFEDRPFVTSVGEYGNLRIKSDGKIIYDKSDGVVEVGLYAKSNGVLAPVQKTAVYHSDENDLGSLAIVKEDRPTAVAINTNPTFMVDAEAFSNGYHPAVIKSCSCQKSVEKMDMQCPKCGYTGEMKPADDDERSFGNAIAEWQKDASIEEIKTTLDGLNAELAKRESAVEESEWEQVLAIVGAT